MLQVPYPLSEEEKVHYLKRIFASRKTSKTRDYFQGWLLITTLKTILIYRKNTVEANHSTSKVHFEGDDLIIKDGKATITIYSVPEAREIVDVLSYRKEGYEKVVQNYLARGHISSARALLRKAPKEIQATETYARAFAETSFLSFSPVSEDVLSPIKRHKELFQARNSAVRRDYTSIEELVYFIKPPEAHLYWAMASYGIILSSEEGTKRSRSTLKTAGRILARNLRKSISHFSKLELVEKFLLVDFINTEIKDKITGNLVMKLARKLTKEENPYLRTAAAGIYLRNEMKEKAREVLTELFQEDLEEELFMKCVELLRGANL